jgi:signal peptidase
VAVPQTPAPRRTARLRNAAPPDEMHNTGIAISAIEDIERPAKRRRRNRGAKGPTAVVTKPEPAALLAAFAAEHELVYGAAPAIASEPAIAEATELETNTPVIDTESSAPSTETAAAETETTVACLETTVAEALQPRQLPQASPPEGASEDLPHEVAAPKAAIALLPAPVDAPSVATPEPSRVSLRRAARIAWTIVSWTSVVGAAAAVTALLAVIVVPRALGWKGMVVLSGSMEPTLHTGGMAFMQPLSSSEVEDIEPGDIITFRREGSDASISHRVVEVLGEEDSLAFVTKGDANNANDATAVEAKDVEGKVRWDVPYLGSLVDRLQTRSTYYAFIGIPAALLVLSETWNIASELRRTRRDKHSTLAEGASS